MVLYREKCLVGWHMKSRLEEKLEGRGFHIGSLAIALVREDGVKTSSVVIRKEKRVKFNKYLEGKIIQI